MRALIVYESLYGNTHIIANSIAEGLRDKACDVTVVPVNRATAELVRETDLLVVGGPTHMHGMSSSFLPPDGRRGGQEAGQRADPGAGPSPPGCANGCTASGRRHGLAAAAFDTRLEGPAVLTGRASSGIAHRLLRHGYRLVVSPESFLVSKQNALLRTEANRAQAWGAALAFAASGPIGLSAAKLSGHTNGRKPWSSGLRPLSSGAHVRTAAGHGATDGARRGQTAAPRPQWADGTMAMGPWAWFSTGCWIEPTPRRTARSPWRPITTRSARAE